jgi:hypothetical protein
VDPGEAEALAAAGDSTSPAFRAHSARCPECAALHAAVSSLAKGGGPHPAADALVRFEEEPSQLSERSRAWIADHVASCGDCREVLRSIPSPGAPAAARRPRFAALPLLAAAGWILAAILALRVPRGTVTDGAPVLATQTITLSQTRGAAGDRVRAVDVVRFECVIGDEVKEGSTLHVAVEDAAGKVVLETDAPVGEVNAFGWPVISLRRAALPRGPMTIRVRAPSGGAIAVVLDG